jgi:hypothetical protein
MLDPDHKLKLLVANRPWESEPDNAEWEDKATGYKCRIVRHEAFGSLCGYVGIPKNHPLHGVEYSKDACADIQVHGGLTYSSTDDDDKNENTWWFGFDCAHAGDFVPKMAINMLEHGFDYERTDTYRTWEYVENEVRELVRQLRDEDSLANQIPNFRRP